ncbi:glycosyltransferase family 2 protein [Leucobacter sp. W1038]|uniref:glycosyltransferase family 2 protein n=1 Tax=Leucobacter sp. W1038 TaxID=3438281 RepID=UPI003D98C597
MHLTPLPSLPAVSYVMPVLNEEEHLETAVRTILGQQYKGEKEIVLALGPSTDRSTEIADRLAAADPRVRLVENPGRDIPIGLNLAIATSRFPVVVRVDAHSELVPEYTSAGIAALRREGAANVGGVMQAAGRTTVQRAIAAGYNSPYGLGGGAYHGDGTPGPAESAYLGIFRREAIEAVGGYDPGIRRGEDWELNLRIRMAGGIVWFDPSLRVTYWPRASLPDLSRQFFATGAWRAVLVRRHPRAHPWRFFAPGALVLALTTSLVVLALQCVGLVPWAWWSVVHALPLAYAGAVAFGTTRLPALHGVRERLVGAAVLVTMHVSWGVGFLVGIAGGASRTVDRSRAR